MAKYNYKPGVMYEVEVCGDNVMRVAAGTTGNKGGDAGHGGWTRIEIEDMGATWMMVDWDEKATSLAIEVRGDSELHTLKEALRHCLKVLDGQTRSIQRDENAENEVEINPFENNRMMARS